MAPTDSRTDRSLPRRGHRGTETGASAAQRLKSVEKRCADDAYKPPCVRGAANHRDPSSLPRGVDLLAITRILFLCEKGFLSRDSFSERMVTSLLFGVKALREGTDVEEHCSPVSPDSRGFFRIILRGIWRSYHDQKQPAP